MVLFCAPESKVQLGSTDGGADSWVVLLGLHRDANPGRIHILKAGCEQVTQAAMHFARARILPSPFLKTAIQPI